MNVCLWFIFLCGACVYNRNQLSQRKAPFLLLSPDVNDKVSCGFGWLFDMHFKRGKNFTTIEANLQWRFFFLFFLLLLSFSLLRKAKQSRVSSE